MFKDTEAFSGFAVDDVPRLYGEALGLDVSEANGMLTLQLGGGASVLVYPKLDHTPASFTILNFPVDDIERAVQDLTDAGVRMEHYTGELQTDEQGIALVPDPAGNILSVLQEDEGP